MTETKWTIENFERAFREYLGETDGSPQARKRARILAAATELFLNQGYRKTSVDQIAARAHVAKGTVYLYFESKAAILVQAIALEKKGAIGLLTPILNGEIPERERLRWYLEFTLKWARELPLSARVTSQDRELMAALDDIGASEVAERRAQSEEWVMELVELAAPGVFTEDEKRERAKLLITLSFFSVLLLKDYVRGGRSLDEMAAKLADVINLGLIQKSEGR